MDFWKTFQIVGTVAITALLVAAFIYGTTSPEPVTGEGGADANSATVPQPTEPASNNGGAQFF